MARAPELADRPLSMTRPEAALLGLPAGGCRLAFAAPAAHALQGAALRRLEQALGRLGGALVQVQSDTAAAAMAAGAALCGARAAAVVADGAAADSALAGLGDLTPVLVDVSGRLPLNTSQMRAVLAPHTAQAAFEAGAALFDRALALHGPALIAGFGDGDEAAGLVAPRPASAAEAMEPVPIHHDGPDDADLLLIGAGPGFEACVEARDFLEAEGVAAAHLHVLQVAPFPGAIVAPAITSARRVLVVEPGGPGSLAALIRGHLGAPAAPFGELPRPAGAPIGPEEIVLRARAVMLL